uniref:Uncharacterized protein n=1 Tax=Ditylenchus dipsaci TaxID=166011 RepID=A0A915CRH4_9BILA
MVFFSFRDSFIDKAVEHCCSAESSACCLDRLKNDFPILCGTQTWSEINLEESVCIENFFYNKSIIETGAHKCCHTLSTNHCRQTCNRQLLQPTLPFEEKFTFIDDCPHHDVPQEQLSCRYSKYVLHDCFRTCLGWMAKKMKIHRRMAGDPRRFRSVAGREPEFQAYLHCPKYKDFKDSDLCMIVTDK